MIRLATAPLCLLVASLVAGACAPRQEYRSAAEAACAAEAERIVLERNRARSVRLDSPGLGAQTIMEETNISTRFARESEFSERRRLTRECLERLSAEEARRNAATPPPQPAGSQPAAATSQPAAATSQPAPAPRAAPVGFERGTALPPPASAPASAPGAAPGARTEPAIRGW
jgi:hypothetical protein